MAREQELSRCRKCGAAVEQVTKHKEWHEILERLVPGLADAQEGMLERRRGAGGPMWGSNS